MMGSQEDGMKTRGLSCKQMYLPRHLCCQHATAHLISKYIPWQFLYLPSSDRHTLLRILGFMPTFLVTCGNVMPALAARTADVFQLATLKRRRICI
eukprot:scaffold118141_cov13-Prasinocladus_malaysianus.AAC.1